MGALIPWISGSGPFKPALDDSFGSFTAGHPLGTDQLGRDFLVRLAYGARYTIGIAISASLVGAICGISAGVVAGYYRGALDVVVMRGMDVLLAFPGVLIAFLVIAILGVGVVPLVWATAVYTTPVFARLAYGACRSVMAQQYIDAAIARGAGPLRVMSRHVFPNIFSEMVVLWTLRLAITVMLVTSLSFLGLGVQPPTPEWGALLSDGRAYMRTYPLLEIIPGAAVTLLVISINLFGEGLQQALDPRSTVRRRAASPERDRLEDSRAGGRK
ncbi:MAG TPA: ABC transporter permease [Arthrobacter sp.]|nr:ABC transporter permease [Arthrobacter sp.]